MTVVQAARIDADTTSVEGATVICPAGGRDPSALPAELERAVERCRSGQPAWRYFDKRSDVHALMQTGRCQRMTGEPAKQAIDHALGSPVTDRERVAYVHIPFCRYICTFCGFCRFVSDVERQEEYLLVLRRQIQHLLRRPWAQAAPFKALYFGGGTPSTLPAEHLGGLVGMFRDLARFEPEAEITVECRFDGVDRTYLQCLRDAGVNRISFGVQSFDTQVRRYAGRIADRERVLERISEALSIGFASVSADLIINLPRQDRAIWRKDLDTLSRSGVTAASIYALIPFGNSALGARLISGKEPPLGGIDYEYECYCLAHETLTDRAGWRAFSPVHYGDAHRESWVYSSARSGDMDVLGLGCGAGGMIEKLSYMNPMQLDDYLDDRDPTVVRREECSTNRQIIARMTEGDGIDRRTFCNAVAGAAAILESLSFLGLIHENDGRLTLTRDGSFWAYNIGRILAQHVEQAAIE